MTSVTLTWGQVLVLLVGVLAIYCLEMAFFYWRLRRQSFAQQMAELRLQQLEQKIQALQRQLYPEPLSAMPPPTYEAAGSGLEDMLDDDVTPPEEEALSTASSEPVASYNRAIELARQGADAGILSRDCGLSRGEADLIVSLYGPKSA